MTTITLDQLTTVALDGTGVFDKLMQANKAHLQAEFEKGRIKGAEYATVYLGSMQAVMEQSLSFLLQKEKVGLEAALMAKQVEIANLQLQKTQVELDMLLASQAKIPAEIALLVQQELNLKAEKTLTVAKSDQAVVQTANLTQEGLNIPRQGLILDAQKLQILAQKDNLLVEKLGIEAKTQLTGHQSANAVIEGTVLTATACKLKAEFDVIKSTDLKVQSETGLLNQKQQTEKAQITKLGVDDDSVVGRQKSLYFAQTAGFQRDAEQKAAKLLVDTWNVRRTTNEDTTASAENLLDDATIKRAMTKLLSGINA